MASSSSTNESFFGETEISPAIDENKALQFFQEHGIFYESDAEIGSLVATLGSSGLDPDHGIDQFRSVYMRKPRCWKLLEGFKSDFAFVMGADGYYYASTTDEKVARNRITVYMWTSGTSLEFAENSHTCAFQTINTSPYRLCVVPYVQIQGKLEEIPLKFKDGGILIVHPRLTVRVEQGSAHVYAGPVPPQLLVADLAVRPE